MTHAKRRVWIRIAARWRDFETHVTEQLKDNSDDWRTGLAIAIVVVAIAVLGARVEVEGRPVLIDPWAGMSLGLIFAAMQAFRPWLTRTLRPGQMAALTLPVALAFQLCFLLYAVRSSTNGVCYGFLLVFSIIASAHALRFRAAIEEPFLLMTTAVGLATAATLARDRERLIPLVLLMLCLLPALALVGHLIRRSDEAREAARRARDENAQLMLDIKSREVAMLETFLERLTGHTHDLGGPILALNAAVERLQEVASGAVDPRVSSLIERIAAVSRELEVMIQSAKREIRDVSLPPEEPASVLEVSKGVSERVRLRFPLMRIEIDGPPEATVLLRGGASALARVLDNLETNACEETQGKGTVRIVWTRHADRWRLAVEDDGPGFTNDTTPESNGLGVGLRSVRRIVETSGGSLVVGTALSLAGARIEITLPSLS